MTEQRADDIRELADSVYRTESRRILATLIRLLGDFDLAEDALHDAFRAALEKWPKEGVPGNPRAWLISAGRFKALDALRRRVRFEGAQAAITDQIYPEAVGPNLPEEEGIEDDRLRLVFTCCHPALAAEARVALTLREVCGLTTEEIARAFLSTPATLAQRIVRAKAKIRDARIPYQVPSPAELPERLETVLQVVYLVFNEGYSAGSDAEKARARLSEEAIRLGRLLLKLFQTEPEVMGLTALMLLQHARSAARFDAQGAIVLLEDQDRTLWNRDMIGEGLALIDKAMRHRRPGPYQIQAAIAALHCRAARPQDTDWAGIAALYGALEIQKPSPVVTLNRAVAVSKAQGPAEALAMIEPLAEALGGYFYFFGTRGALLLQLGRDAEARAAFDRAIALANTAAEAAHIRGQIDRLSADARAKSAGAHPAEDADGHP
jgi:RNA polymerase sigma-70 factor, ECF subfamily